MTVRGVSRDTWFPDQTVSRCVVFDCGRPVHARELCSLHYDRQRRARLREEAARRLAEPVDAASARSATSDDGRGSEEA